MNSGDQIIMWNKNSLPDVFLSSQNSLECYTAKLAPCGNVEIQLFLLLFRLSLQFQVKGNHKLPFTWSNALNSLFATWMRKSNACSPPQQLWCPADMWSQRTVTTFAKSIVKLEKIWPVKSCWQVLNSDYSSPSSASPSHWLTYKSRG